MKIRELKAMLSKAGFRWRTGKASHTIWEHPLAERPVTLFGSATEVARRYHEQQVNLQLAVVQRRQQ